MLFKSLLLASLCVSLLATSNANAAGLDLSGLLQATQADLYAADQDAKAHGDVIASQCYEGLHTFLAANPLTAPTINIVGVASAFQTIRDGVKLANTVKTTGLLPQPVIIACGPLALDVQNDLGKVAGNTFSLTLFGGKIF